MSDTSTGWLDAPFWRCGASATPKVRGNARGRRVSGGPSRIELPLAGAQKELPAVSHVIGVHEASANDHARDDEARAGAVVPMDELEPARISPPRILIIDDDADLRRTLVEYLEHEGLLVSEASNHAEMVARLNDVAVSLVLLDLRLGREEGLELLRDIRNRNDLPVIIITGHRRDEMDRIVGLELGADDYVTKPFSLRELLARIRTVMRRAKASEPEPERDQQATRLRFGGWEFDRRARCLSNPAGEPVKLSKGEFALLAAFVDAPGRPLSREFLLQATRIHEEIFDRSIDVQVLRLRRKLEVDPSDPRVIRTERGFGYTFALQVETLRGLHA